MVFLYNLKESDGYYNELNLLNEKIDSYKNIEDITSRNRNVDVVLNSLKLKAKQFIQMLFANVVILFQNVFLYFDAWKSRVKYEISVMRLNPDYRPAIDFFTSIWNAITYCIKRIIYLYVLRLKNKWQSDFRCAVLEKCCEYFCLFVCWFV